MFPDIPGMPVWSFNTQPPEGGWYANMMRGVSDDGFNTQPPEGGWMGTKKSFTCIRMFQHTAA